MPSEASSAPDPRPEIVPNPLTLYTDDGLVLRQHATPEDDEAYFRLQNENHDHIARFNNKIFSTIDEVREARLNPKGVIRMGIYRDDVLIGEVGVASPHGEEAEIGIWLAENATGHGYGTSAVKAATDYALRKYKRVFSEVAPGNTDSIKLLKRVGYYEPEPGRIVERKWGKALVFEVDKPEGL